MSKLLENYALKKHNSFGIEAKAKQFFEFEEASEIREFLAQNKLMNMPYFVLGGGSNLLLTKDFDGLVLYPKIKGIQVIEENKTSVLLKVGANENWDQFVSWCVERNYGGIENLSLIPGLVGASPVQNIGAYGVEVKNAIEKVEAISLQNGNEHIFNHNDCEFSYRNSVFKGKYKNLFVITHVQFRLNKQAKFELSYGSVKEELRTCQEINLKNIREAIIKIRNSKLPNPEEIGNAGSFFKNPIVSSQKAKQLYTKFPNMPIYKLDETRVKLAAGWLIEQCGWKGKRFGDAGVHKNQALVLVNYGMATGVEILQLSNEICKSVELAFGVKLEKEVNVI